jgi:hypothetical protein
MSLPPDIQAFLDRYGDNQKPKRDTKSKDYTASSRNWEFYAEVSVGREEEPRRCVPDRLTISELHKECGVAIWHNTILIHYSAGGESIKFWKTNMDIFK